MGKKYDNQEHESKKIFTLVLLIIIFMLCTTGATYAYFAISAVNNTITGTAATISLDLDVQRVAPSDEKWNQSTKIMVPQLDAGLETAMNDTYNCIDDNNNVVCQVYKITVTNSSTSQVNLRGRLFFSYTGENSNFNNLHWRIAESTNTLGSNNSFKASTSEDVVSTNNDEINASLVESLPLVRDNGAATYYVVVWIREINASQNDSTTDPNYDQGTWNMTVAFRDKANPNGGVTSTITS